MGTGTMKIKPKNRFTFSIYCPDQRVMPDISIQLTDVQGRVSRLPLNSVITLQRLLHVTLTRLSLLEQPSPVIVLRTVSIPLSLFSERQQKLDLTNLKKIDFLFNGGSAGTAMLDDIGFD